MDILKMLLIGSFVTLMASSCGEVNSSEAQVDVVDVYETPTVEEITAALQRDLAAIEADYTAKVNAAVASGDITEASRLASEATTKLAEKATEVENSTISVEMEVEEEGGDCAAESVKVTNFLGVEWDFGSIAAGDSKTVTQTFTWKTLRDLPDSSDDGDLEFETGACTSDTTAGIVK